MTRRLKGTTIAEIDSLIVELGSRSAVADHFKINVSTLRRYYLHALQFPPKPKAPQPIELSAEDDRQEIRNQGFWRKRAAAFEKDLAHVEKLLIELGGVRSQYVQPAEWMLDTRPGKRGKSVVGLLLTDIHAGEVISSDELLGLNAYDIDICRARLRRLFAATCEVGTRWASDSAVQGVVLTLGGDLISGDIHEELRITNALTSHEQVRFAAEEIAGGIRHLLAAFGRVHVVSVPGNHGRTTFKPTAKLYARLSYDTLIAHMVADAFAGDDRVTFQITASHDAIFPVLGYTVLATHGDKMGTGGGQGFAGPVLPIVRGTKKIEAQQARAGRRPDLILHGHYHTSANPGPVLANGSVPGYSEYGNGLRAALEPPQQWAFIIHQRWGLRERAEIKLENPTKPELPRVRIPAVMR